MRGRERTAYLRSGLSGGIERFQKVCRQIPAFGKRQAITCGCESTQSPTAIDGRSIARCTCTDFCTSLEPLSTLWSATIPTWVLVLGVRYSLRRAGWSCAKNTSSRLEAANSHVNCWALAVHAALISAARGSWDISQLIASAIVLSCALEQR